MELSSGASQSLEVIRRALAGSGILDHVEGQFLAFDNRRQTGSFQCGGMDEYVLCSVVGLDESKSLCGVVEFYCTSAHIDFLSIIE
jgi:hypothetical protein